MTREPISLRAHELAGRLREARDTARRLLGDRYEENVEPWRELAAALAREWKCSVLEVPHRLDQVGELPSQPLLLFAAITDVCSRQADEAAQSRLGASILGIPVVTKPGAKDIEVRDSHTGQLLGRIVDVTRADE